MTYRESVEAAKADGFTYFDFLTASDHGTYRRLAVHLINLNSNERLLITKDLQVDEAPTISDLYEGATWHERETAEMFGITFTGLKDDRPLLTRPDMPTHPLRKSS